MIPWLTQSFELYAETHTGCLIYLQLNKTNLLVNLWLSRTKHPDEGTSYDWEDTFEDVPPPIELSTKEAANEAIIDQLLP